MGFLPADAELIDATVPYGPGALAWPLPPPIVAAPVRHIAAAGASNGTPLRLTAGEGAPARALLVRR